VVYYARVAEDAVPGNQPDSNHGIVAPSGWVGTQQAARSLGVSPRTVRWHIEHGNLVARPEGEGVRRTWLISIDSLQAFRDARQSAGNLPRTDRAAVEDANIAAESLGNPIRELADRLAEEAARAAEYRVRLELTEQAQTSLEEELATERRRREEAERERDELRQRVEVSSEPREATEKGSEETTRGGARFSGWSK
jgi:nucleoside-diphosphate-sugar epimerase